jgi:2'-5' RNA ligase
MTEKKKTPYERVSDAMHGVDDTMRDILTYPSRNTVLGISEADYHLVLSSANSHDDGEDTQVIWINTDNIETLEALQESISRVLSRARAKQAKN